MIDLNRLYEIAPQLAPKSYKKKSVKISRTVRIDYSNFENAFRSKLLRNLEAFRDYKHSSFVTKTYSCASRKSETALNSSVSSFNTQGHSFRSFNHPIIALASEVRKSPKTQRIENGLKLDLETEQKTYNISMASTLKSTVPRFLQSSRTKLMRGFSNK